jgi:hypothetical protein
MKTILNHLANWVKVVGIIVTDIINRVFDPFEEFDRPVEQKYQEWLWEKERKFTKNMESFFWPDRSVWLYKHPIDSGDQCLWHGVYVAMWALRYSVTCDPIDASRLEECIHGLRQHQSPTGESIPRLIRGWRVDGTYEDAVSNDQATGHLLGIYFAWKHGTLECRRNARNLILGLADELAIYDNKLVNADKSVTKHGALENGYYTDPLNLTLCLAIYRVAYALTHEYLYFVRYKWLVERYFPLISYANVRCLWWEKTHHAHRAAIHYSILCDLENDRKLRDRYLKGLIRTWKMERKSGNPWIYYLLRRVCTYDENSIENCRKHLKEFTLEDKQWNMERINSPQVASFRWGKHLRAYQPLPRWKVGSQDFFWQRHLYAVDDWIGHGKGIVEHNGGDYLIAYWGLRSLGLILPSE